MINARIQKKNQENGEDAKTEGALPNFHTHTELCKHADGTAQDYLIEAAGAGCSALGFSDHCPYPSEDADMFWPASRMSEADLPVYAEWVRRAKRMASAAGLGFPVYFGFECEWDEAMYSWYKDDLLGALGAEYLVLGSHWVTMEDGEHIYIVEVTDSASLLHRYIDQTIAGMASGVYKFMAHPDIFMSGWREWDAEAIACSNAIIDAAEDLALPLEVNGFGLIKRPNETSRGMRFQYPYKEFWEIVAERGLPVICNSDAHSPEHVIKNAANARRYALEVGIKPENIVGDFLR